MLSKINAPFNIKIRFFLINSPYFYYFKLYFLRDSHVLIDEPFIFKHYFISYTELKIRKLLLIRL